MKLFIIFIAIAFLLTGTCDAGLIEPITVAPIIVKGIDQDEEPAPQPDDTHDEQPTTPPAEGNDAYFDRLHKQMEIRYCQERMKAHGLHRFNSFVAVKCKIGGIEIGVGD